jgi:hypothetical protein
VRRAAVPIVAALLLTGIAGCGSGAVRSTARHAASLCVDAGLPLSGRDGAAGRAVLAGLRMRIPPAGLSIGGYRIRLCRVFNDAASAQAVVADARLAAEKQSTIAYVGELSGSRAAVADAVLAEADIALITPSGPAPAPARPSVATPAAPAPARHTALYLLPSTRSQADAVSAISSAHSCSRRRRRRPVCSVFSPPEAPLCTGIAATAPSSTQRLCVLAGPDLSADWTTPARAYGDSAGQLLASSLNSLTQDGEDIANRSSVLHGLSHANLGTSPIGAIRFDAAGGIEADLFTAYTVSGDGALGLSQQIHTH